MPPGAVFPLFRLRLVLICCVLVVVAPGPGCRDAADGRSADAPAELTQVVDPRGIRIDESLSRWEAFGFSGAVLLAEGDRVLLSRGYGYADRSAKTPVTVETLFDIGSLSKQFTAAIDNYRDSEAKARTLYGKLRNASDGFDAALEAKRRELPFSVESFSPASDWSGKAVLAELFTGCECLPCVAADSRPSS